jgi:acetolactate synthase small subunit
MNTVKTFNIKIYTCNCPNILNRISLILTRKLINIDYLSMFSYEKTKVFNLSIKTHRKEVQNIIKQLDKQIEIFETSYFEID